MKKIIVGLLALGTISAFASDPGIGSYSEYKISGNGYMGTYKIQIVGYDDANDLFTQQYTTYVNGSQSVENEELAGDEVNTKDENKQILDYCETSHINGVLEKIKVPAGEFETCKLTAEDGQITYMGPVPFGFVKLMTPDGGVFELTKYEYK